MQPSARPATIPSRSTAWLSPIFGRLAVMCATIQSPVLPQNTKRAALADSRPQAVDSTIVSYFDLGYASHVHEIGFPGGETGYLHVVAGVWCLHEQALSQVEPDVAGCAGGAVAAGYEQQVAG